MAITFKIKRRNSGAAGAPSALKSGELAMNWVDEILYAGKGDDGSGNATSVEAIAGKGNFCDLTTNQTIGGTKIFSNSPLAPTPSAGDNSTKVATTAFVTNAVSGAGGDMFKAIYDANNNGKVDVAETAESVTSGATGATATAGDNSTKLATTAFVATAIANLIASAPGALDTLNELAAALGNDANFAATITSALAGKADLVLSNLSNTATARTNLGLGTMATQNANAVNITGGTIDGVTLDGGTF